jgi:succinate dehydrogenase / fumarate reductase cytochrome b subunit
MRGSAQDFGYFWLYRLHAITGMVFALAFVFCFLLPYSSIFGGPAEFNHFMAKVGAIPMLGLTQTIFIVLPLIFHAALGLMIVHGCQINAFSYGFYRNWMYALQRITGIILIPFVAYHVYKTYLVMAFNGKSVDFNFMHSLLAHPWAKVFYCVGIVCTAFYIGNGFASQSTAWGIAASRRARSAASVLGWVVTLGLVIWGLRLVFYF